MFMDLKTYYSQDHNTPQSKKFNAVLIKISMMILQKIEKSILTWIWKIMGSPVAKIILKTCSQVGGLTLPDFKMYYKATAMVLAQERHINQWTRTENSEINPYIYGQLIFDKGVRAIQQEKIICSTRGAARTAGYPRARE